MGAITVGVMKLHSVIGSASPPLTSRSGEYRTQASPPEFHLDHGALERGVHRPAESVLTMIMADLVGKQGCELLLIGLEVVQSLRETKDLDCEGQHIAHRRRFARLGIASKLVDELF
jgi:hypothetical protein